MIAAVVERCAGIDVGKRFLKVCVMVGPLSEEPRIEIRKVDCTSTALEGLRQWLKAEGVTQVVMESTGPYWVPVFNVLEGDVKVVLANPVEVKNRKGHKTDAQDCWWLAHLLRHGMIRASFIPEKATRDLRELTRRRKKLVQQAAQERNRVQKQLEYGNVKLSDTQKEMIRSSMRHMTFLELEIEQLDGLVVGLIRESGQQKQHELLQTIPGIKQEAAGNLLAETGSDMTQFPDAGHLSSWGGICPGNNESAGKHKSRHTTHGNPWFRATLTECAWSASRTKGSAFETKYESLKPKIGHPRALVAVAHMLTHAIYYVLSRGEAYRETKPKELNEIQRQRIIRHHTRRLRRLGCWLPAEKLTPLQEWYVTHRIPEMDLPQPKRRGRKKGRVINKGTVGGPVNP